MIFRKGLYIFLSAISLLATGCSSGNEPPQVSDVKLKLQIVVGEALAEGTRASASFEDPAYATERLHTLRVIIVRGNPLDYAPGTSDLGYELSDGAGIIEHNRMVTVDAESEQKGVVQIINDNLEFLVESGETKTIYLFGNEKAIADDFKMATGLALEDLKPGYKFPTEAALKATFSRTSGSPWIDNSSLAPGQVPINIPMTERFAGIEIPVPDEEVRLEISKTLFVERAPVKFSFHFDTDGYDGNQFITNDEEELRVTGVRLDGIADSGFILPNSTTYDPGKNASLTGTATPERVITQFAMPDQVGFSSLYIPVGRMDGQSEGIDVLRPGMNFNFSSPLYVPETMTTASRTVSLSVELNGEYWLGPVALPELTSYELARNTHMRINVTFVGTSIKAEVDLEPYVGVTLDPVFGIVRPEEQPETDENA